MWGRLPLAGLLLAGCSFSPGGTSGSGSEPDAGGFSDGLPDPDGGPGEPDGAGQPDGTVPIAPVLLETLTIQAAEADPIQSTVVLVAGQSYRLVASGEVVVRDDDLVGRIEGDADYWYDGIISGDGSNGVDMGLAVNDTDGPESRSPDWGEYSDSHVYEATIEGDGAVLSAVFFDPDHGNGNSGSLSLEIWGPPP